MDSESEAGLRYVDPRHGTHAPTTGSPARPRGSVRRTTTVDARRPEGFAAGLSLVGQGRDLVTHADGAADVVARAATKVEIRYTGGPIVHAISTDPPVSGTEALIGRVASTGFRAVIDSAVDASAGSILYLLLDETPASVLVSGYAIGHAASRGEFDVQDLARIRPPGAPLQIPDLCACLLYTSRCV